MSARLLRRVVVALGALAAVVLVTVAANSTLWLDASFPGFFVMANRVVPSIALPDWADGPPSRLFQHEIVAVDGIPVQTAEDVYARVHARGPGTRFRYTARAPDGEISTVAVASRVFAGRDYTLIFGAFLMNGVAFLGAGLLVPFLKPDAAASRGLLSLGVTVGMFVLTAIDLYGPHWFFRLHVVAESFLAAGFIHLALVFPTDRIRNCRLPALIAVYLPFALLAVVYERALTSPSAYTAAHLCATATHGLGAVTLVAMVAWDLVRSESPLVRRRVALVALGTAVAFLVPAIFWAWSVVVRGSVPLNTAAFTAFLFPLSLAYAIVKQDLFEIDVMLRRATGYVVTVLAIAAVYLAALALLGLVLPKGFLAQSPLALAIFNLAVLFLIAPVKARAQADVDRVFFRRGYDAERALSDLSDRLVAAHTLPDVIARTREVLGETVCPASAAILLPSDGGVLRRADESPAEGPVSLPSELAARLTRGGIIARYEWDDGTGRLPPAFWQSLAADVLVAISSGDVMLGVLAVGRKASGKALTVHDTAFLRAAASQVALAMMKARAFGELEALNASLEHQVRERTSALEAANSDLNRSFEQLNQAYQQLERNQASLMRADRLATLGRLIAGIAHEVNTPLGAVINSLALLTDLSREYAESIDDPAVSQEDHHEIAREIGVTAESATGWARRAAAFISKVKIHGRDPGQGGRRRFTVESVVNETRALLAHRLRATGCQLSFAEEPGSVGAVGDPSRLGQVLVNLVANAIDAYEDARVAGSIEVRARWADGALTVTVRDRAGGMPPEVAARIFDELYTTKEPGRGTGLGLWIARNLIEESFGGTLTVETELGVGSCFTIAMPADGRVTVDLPEAEAGTSSTGVQAV